MTEQEAAQLREKNAQLQAQLTAANEAAAAAAARDAQAAAAARTAEHTAFAEALIEQAKVPEADKARIVAIADAIHPPGDAPVMFGEGDGKTTLYAQFKSFLEGLKPSVEFGEQATRGRAGSADGGAPEVEYAEGADPQSIELDKKIRAHMAAHKVTYAAAYAAVTK